MFGHVSSSQLVVETGGGRVAHMALRPTRILTASPPRPVLLRWGRKKARQGAGQEAAMKIAMILTTIILVGCASPAPTPVPMKNLQPTVRNAASCQSVQDALPKGNFSPQQSWVVFINLLSIKMNGGTEQLTRMVMQSDMNKQLDELIYTAYVMSRETTRMILMMCSHDK